jgi:hypothetical protein
VADEVVQDLVATLLADQEVKAGVRVRGAVEIATLEGGPHLAHGLVESCCLSLSGPARGQARRQDLQDLTDV